MSEISSTPSNVLVIEDDVPMRRFLRAALENEGHRVTEAGTARDGMTHDPADIPRTSSFSILVSPTPTA